MLYLLLAPLFAILGTLFVLRLWTVLFTEHPITDTEMILRAFVVGFRQGYNGVESTTSTKDQVGTTSMEEEYQTLTFDIAESMAEQLIAEAWSEAKAASKQSSV